MTDEKLPLLDAIRIVVDIALDHFGDDPNETATQTQIQAIGNLMHLIKNLEHQSTERH